MTTAASQASGGVILWGRKTDASWLHAAGPNARTPNATGASFDVGAVRPLFGTRPKLSGFPYDLADGQRFLVNTLVEEASSTPITLVVN